jgi:PilZ domain
VLHIGLTSQEIAHLQQVIARLDAQGPSEGADRRLHPRIDFAHPMWINLPAEPGQPWVHVYSRNLSTGGVSFLSRHLFYAGQHLVISHELNELVAMVVLCRVCFCRTIDLGIQEVGMAFVAARADPHRAREIPPEWMVQVLQNDALTRRHFPVAAGA